MTHPFWKKHNPDYAVATFATWGIGLGAVLVFLMIKEWLKA
jgi:hypothetical protein